MSAVPSMTHCRSSCGSRIVWRIAPVGGRTRSNDGAAGVRTDVDRVVPLPVRQRSARAARPRVRCGPRERRVVALGEAAHPLERPVPGHAARGDRRDARLTRASTRSGHGRRRRRLAVTLPLLGDARVDVLDEGARGPGRAARRSRAGPRLRKDAGQHLVGIGEVVEQRVLVVHELVPAHVLGERLAALQEIARDRLRARRFGGDVRMGLVPHPKARRRSPRRAAADAGSRRASRASRCAPRCSAPAPAVRCTSRRGPPGPAPQDRAGIVQHRLDEAQHVEVVLGLVRRRAPRSQRGRTESAGDRSDVGERLGPGEVVQAPLVVRGVEPADEPVLLERGEDLLGAPRDAVRRRRPRNG